jgi:hypothetical protein
MPLRAVSSATMALIGHKPFGAAPIVVTEEDPDSVIAGIEWRGRRNIRVRCNGGTI